MKKIKGLIFLAMILMVVTACTEGNGTAEELKEEATKDVLQSTVEETVEVEIKEEIEDELIDRGESRKAIDQWKTEIEVNESEDGSLELIYTVIEPDGKLHTFSEEPWFDMGWYKMFTEAGGKVIELVDYDFDGYPDLHTHFYGAYVNAYLNIRIWNEDLGKFELSEQYMALPNIEVDSNHQRIFSVNYDNGFGDYYLYEVVDRLLVLVAEIDGSVDEDGNLSYTEKINGSEKIVTKVSELDPIWGNHKVYIEDY